MRIYHVATLADWQRAKASGSYTTSTYGASLADVGFIHAARREQVTRVVDTFYAEVDEPILLLEIETDLLDVPWREDDVDGERFPHIYGPLSPRAVVGFHSARETPDAPMLPPRPRDPVARAFWGLSAVLFAATFSLLVLGVIASVHERDYVRPSAAPTVLWSLTLTAGVATITCWVVALTSDRHPR
ncbi:DUF952 domain-containing protein [Nocardioides cynanchi]|uniref:DUF952 domain-containing protein n=1 Tax=Nocardioides cynanchi TaxID=2558918 RepID=UPI0012440DB4|nr:DUF952 domain-containing protein [Nocardioides cynanchi]